MTAMLRRLARDRRGVAGLEAGLVITFLLSPLLAGVIGVGQAMLTQYRVDRATHAALMAAWYAPATATPSVIQGAAQDGYGTANGTALTTVASLACYCLDPTGTRTSGSTTVVSCSGTCASSTQVLGTWVTVASSATFTPIFLGSWGASTWTLSASSTVRIK